jgi:predicted secreted protein
LLVASCGGDSSDDSRTAGASDGGTTTAPTTPAENAGQEVERFNNPTGTVTVPVGQVFQITLDADAEACFSWDLKTTDSDVVTLETSRPSAIATQDDPPLVGASNTDVFEFSAAKAGSVDLKFEEISPCDPGTTRDTRTITVTVS